LLELFENLAISTVIDDVMIIDHPDSREDNFVRKTVDFLLFPFSTEYQLN